MMPKRLLLIGAGSLGKARAGCFAKIPEVTLAGVVSRTEASARALAEAFAVPVWGTDLDAVAAEAQPDAVAITVVNSEHHRYIMWALEHDLDVFVEGPMVVNSTQAVEVVARARERGRIVEVGFQRRYHPLIRRAHDLVQSGRIGPMVYGEVEFFFHMKPAPGEPEPWYLDDAQSGGMAVCHMSYGLNTLRWVLGNPQRVFAAGNNLAFADSKLHMDTLVVTMMYDAGGVGQVSANFSAPPDFPTGVMRLHGTDGGVALQTLYGVHGTFWEGDQQDEIAPEGDEIVGGDDLLAQCQAFATALDTREALLNPPEDSFVELRLIEKALESARTQQTLRVADA